MTEEQTPELLQCLKNDLDHARRNRDKEAVNALSTFILEDSPSGTEKQLTDDEIKRAVEKWIDNINETLNKYELTEDQKDRLVNESNILSDYLPNKLDEEDIKSEVEMIIQTQELEPTQKDMGVIMKKMKELHGSSLDGKVAKDIVMKRINQ